MTVVCRHAITNDTDRLLCLWIEPEGWDCWVKPGESVEVRCQSNSAEEKFDFWKHENGISIYPSYEMEGLITVFQEGTELFCGHQRPLDWPSAFHS